MYVQAAAFFGHQGHAQAARQGAGPTDSPCHQAAAPGPHRLQWTDQQEPAGVGPAGRPAQPGADR